MTPSISRMIKLLSASDISYVSKAKVIALEEEIIKKMDFDFNYDSPLVFLERFLRLTGLQSHKFILSLSKEILKLIITDYSLVRHKPSILAASTLVLSQKLHLSTCNDKKLSLEKTKEDSLLWTDDLVKITGIKQGDFE